MSAKEKKPRANSWLMFTKRTNDPKLTWLQLRLLEMGIETRRNGESFHAPILEVRRRDLARAWEFLTPIDNVPDEDKRFQTPEVMAMIAQEDERT